MIVTLTISMNVEKYPELWEVLEEAKKDNGRSRTAVDLMLRGLKKEKAEIVSVEMLRNMLSQESTPRTKVERDEADKKLDAMFK